MVSVGVPVEDLMGDPNGPAGFNYSVEFCGGTHLINSAHMDQFIVLSEEAIAKGIRRIIALTGPEALKAQKRGDLLERSVADLSANIKSSLQNNSTSVNLTALNKEIFNLSEQVNHSQIAYWRKDQFRQQLEVLKKNLIEVDKSQKAAALAGSLEECKKLVTESPNLEKLVKEFKLGSDSKSLNEVLKFLRQHLPNASLMLFSIDEQNSKITCLSSVPDVI